jgi:hypothetical protein
MDCLLDAAAKITLALPRASREDNPQFGDGRHELRRQAMRERSGAMWKTASAQSRPYLRRRLDIA